MTTALQLRRGTTAQHSTFTGANGEVTVDTDKKTLVVHDGVTPGGRAVLAPDANGNLGLGVTPSAWGFAGNYESTYGWLVGRNQFNLAGNTYYNANSKYFQNGYASNISFNYAVGGITFNVAPSGTAGNAISFTQAMTLDASGNLGIGTSSPGGDANNRVVNATGSSSASFTSICGSVSTNYASVSGNGLVGTATNHPLVFNTNNTERMRIDSSGNVGIGTSSPSGKLHAVQSAGVATLSQAYAAGNFENTFVGGGNPLITLTGSSTAYIASMTSAQAATPLAFATGQTERMRIDTSGNLLFNSGYGSVATAYGCRAWVNFNGTGTVAIRASGNVSSITDNGVDQYTVNFANALPDANYSCVATGSTAGSNGAQVMRTTTFATSSVALAGTVPNVTAADQTYVSVAIFR